MAAVLLLLRSSGVEVLLSVVSGHWRRECERSRIR